MDVPHNYMVADMKPWPHLVFALLTVEAIFTDPCQGAKVLAIPTIIFDSHLYIFVRVAEALKSRGHDAVLLLDEGRAVEPCLHSYRIQRYRGVFSQESSDHWLQERLKRVFEGKRTAFELFSLLEKYLENCDLLLGNATLLQQLRSEEFDLVMVDPNEMCGFIVAHFLGVKYVVLSTSFWFPAEIGATSPVAYVPEFNSQVTDQMGFVGRTWNLLVFLMSRIGTRLLILPKFDRLMAKHDIQPQKSMLELIYGTSLFFLSNDVVIDFPRPTLPHIIFAGGILTGPAKPLPVDLHLWMEAADAGVVVVSFGIGIRMLPRDLVEKMAGAFARLPQRVVWRYSGQKPDNLGENTLMMEWLPLNDLLGHPHVAALVSHCGMNSIYEAIYHGVPVVGFPFYGDQFDIMTRIQAKGMGVLIDWSSVTEDGFYQALTTVISDPSFRRAAKKISELHLDTLMPPLNRTVYWLEYALRHDGAPYLRPSLYRLSFYEYYCLDILAVLFLIVVGTLVVVYRLCWRHRRLEVSPVHLNGHCLNGHVSEEKKGQ
ncbi:PREDICTED: 2-hydroxyacylsphingosine 1-beta-galactosyltransferase-like isoform X1 [Gekko japonicus]|uniref:2-hydroxyacylsphingosine 1-beta-galactosyltransferase-like isoform X1 n=2 Tax=Gekko japonicus TaxID=146911 RepID=A0ABM1L5Y3_GEKJA|nr:PREDICTED: 2-hydroxyacylsphingosine 1-beta-galactosyltransferase-like isoform X1 [Gekko japonicus]